MRRVFFAAVLTTCLAAALPPSHHRPAQTAREWRQRHERAIVEEFMALLAIPNIARDTPDVILRPERSWVVPMSHLSS